LVSSGSITLQFSLRFFLTSPYRVSPKRYRVLPLQAVVCPDFARVSTEEFK